MERSKNIYFISESVPHNGFGSFVIFYRHLLSLVKEGHRVFLIIPDYDNLENDAFFPDLKDFMLIRVPFKKWWFLPYRYFNNFLLCARHRQLYLMIRTQLRENPPHVIISYLHGQYLNGLAVFLQKKFKCFFGVFLHDDKQLLSNQHTIALLKYDQMIVAKANVVWTVSQSLHIENTAAEKYVTLRPLPTSEVFEPIVWKVDYKTPIIGFAGSVYDSYVEVFKNLATALTKFNGKLILITRQYQYLRKELSEYPQIQIVEPFLKNEDALQFLRDRCSAVFCGYPIALNEMPWLKTCFPSKFVESCQIGLPIILTAPPETAISDWADERKWQLFAKDTSTNFFIDVLNTLTNSETWKQNTRQVREIAKDEFSPSKIHNIFRNSFITKGSE